MLDLAALIAAYLIGSLPLGSRLVKWMTGYDARDMNAHNLGVENLLRFVGAPVAFASFALDILKAFGAVALFLGSPWAALGVYAGHLLPLPLIDQSSLPRGRGNGVILGVLAGLWAFSGVPLFVVVAPVLLYSALLAYTGFVTLATLTSLLALPLLMALSGQPLGAMWATGLLFGLALWRHKVGLARIVDGTEPRLGDSPPVRGRDPRVVYAAFMIHALALKDVWQPGSLRWMGPLYERGLLSEGVIRWFLPRMRPLAHAKLRGIELADGRELCVLIISGPMLPDQIRARPEQATAMAIQGARLAYELGAEAFGLGAFWSTVGNKGQDVQDAVPQIHITNGGAYTAASVKAAVPELLRRFRAQGGSLKRASAAVVGAGGVVAFGVARVLAAEVAELVLVGRDLARLERSAATLRKKHPTTTVKTSASVADCAACDLVFTATSDPDPVLYAEHVKPGAWVFDLGRPADVDSSVLEVPGVQVIPGGVVRPPGSMKSEFDLHFGDGLIPACMAETMIMTATREFGRKSLGPVTKTANLGFYLREGKRLGFEIVTWDERVAVLSEVA
ncbi:MAG: glycerol-3-phosphate acyltransferase [Deinococcota bacterium]|jgi:predicted amino acid dehydrogenase|nr:glycerol-3-phosphate acyltransferase [Deinococcota bacterium]